MREAYAGQKIDKNEKWQPPHQDPQDLVDVKTDEPKE